MKHRFIGICKNFALSKSTRKKNGNEEFFSPHPLLTLLPPVLLHGGQWLSPLELHGSGELETGDREVYIKVTHPKNFSNLLSRANKISPTISKTT